MGENTVFQVGDYVGMQDPRRRDDSFIGEIKKIYANDECIIEWENAIADAKVGKRIHVRHLYLHRRPSELGRKDDTGKPQWGLLPFEAVSQVVDVLTFGARKYAPGNWRHVPNANERYFDAAMRHLVAWKQGERLDPESGLHHLAHAGCCVLFALALDSKNTGK